jgi:hypothetical protein
METPRRLKIFKSLKIKTVSRLKNAKKYFKRSTSIFNNALHTRMLFGKNFLNKKYSVQRKN